MTQRKRLSDTQGSQSKTQGSQSKARRSQTLVGDDDEDDDITFTQPSSTQVQRGMGRLTPSQVDQKTGEVTQFILVKVQKKLPIRRADIVKHVLKEYKVVYPEIIKLVGRTFEQVFACKLVEIDTKNHVYILINKLEGDPLSMCPSNPKTGLLFVILGLIFMKGGVVKEAPMWKYLKKLRVDPGERHDDIGDAKKVVTDEFVRQRYLEYVRIPHTEPAEFEFHWGQRADIEVSKVKLLEFMGKLMDQEPQSWTQQYREATAPTPAPASNTQREASQR